MRIVELGLPVEKKACWHCPLGFTQYQQTWSLLSILCSAGGRDYLLRNSRWRGQTLVYSQVEHLIFYSQVRHLIQCFTGDHALFFWRILSLDKANAPEANHQGIMFGGTVVCIQDFYQGRQKNLLIRLMSCKLTWINKFKLWVV